MNSRQTGSCPVSPRATVTLSQLVAALVAVAACGAPMPENRLADPPACADAAIDLALDSWSSILGRDLGDAPAILWFDGACLAYEGDAPGGCLLGATWHSWPGDVEIHALAGVPAGLAHELLHAFIDDQGHEADAWAAAPDVGLAIAALCEDDS